MMAVALRVCVFLSAFLLFSVELMAAKAMLPGFGGSYLVWAGCMVFFQAALLGGYYFSHLVSRGISGRWYCALHPFLFLAPALGFPINPSALSNPGSGGGFAVQVLMLLAKSVGPAFFMLSTSSVLAQAFLSRSQFPEGEDPYFLYGASNLGSLLGLFLYPVLWEPLLDLEAQFRWWQGGYLVLAGLQFPVFFALFRSVRGKAGDGEEEKGGEDGSPLPARLVLRWLLLAAAGSAMFISVTNLITFDLASAPLLWVFPLGAYLLSFALVFRKKPILLNPLTDRFYLLFILGFFLFILGQQGFLLPAWITIFFHLFILFVFCMFCQRELYAARPGPGKGLTLFYLSLALGGFSGSALVSFLFPVITSSLLEYLTGFILVFIALSLNKGKDEPGPRRVRDWAAAFLPAAVLLCWPLLTGFADSKWSPLLAGFVGVFLFVIFLGLQKKPAAVAAAISLCLVSLSVNDYLRTDRKLLFMKRNFYGIYRIYEREGVRYLRHGVTLHGAQYLDPHLQKIPLLYYHPSSPAGEIFTHPGFNFRKIGVVGLGAGSLAAYGRAGQEIDFYELDPDNLPIAEKFFTYLKMSRASLRFRFGDARLSLRNAQEGDYDLLVLDAFNSDSIPVHLLTEEAITEYLKRLSSRGFLLFHISNRHLNLKPILAAEALELGLVPLYKQSSPVVPEGAKFSEWMALVRPGAPSLRVLREVLGWEELTGERWRTSARPWTDRYSNLVSAMLARGGS